MPVAPHKENIFGGSPYPNSLAASGAVYLFIYLFQYREEDLFTPGYAEIHPGAVRLTTHEPPRSPQTPSCGSNRDHTIRAKFAMEVRESADLDCEQRLYDLMPQLLRKWTYQDHPYWRARRCLLGVCLVSQRIGKPYKTTGTSHPPKELPPAHATSIYLPMIAGRSPDQAHNEPTRWSAGSTAANKSI